MPVIAEDNIILRVQADTKKSERNLDRLDDSVDDLNKNTTQLNSNFSKLGGVIKAAIGVLAIRQAARAVANLAGEATKAFAEFEKTEKSFEILVGHVGEAQNLLQGLIEFSNKTPFGSVEVTKSAKTLLGFGRTAKEVRKDIERLGEISAATGADLTNIALVFGQVASLGKLQGQDALQFINAGIPVYDLLAESTGKTTAQLKELQAQGKITFADLEESIIQATEEGGKFAGAIEAQSKSILGLKSTVEDNVQEILRILGQKFAPAVRSFYGFVLQIQEIFIGAVDGIENDFVLRLAAGIETGTVVLQGFTDYVRTWVEVNKAQFKQFGIFVNLIGQQILGALNLRPGDEHDILAQALRSQLQAQGEEVDALLARQEYIFNTTVQKSYLTYRSSIDRLREEAKGDPDYTGSLLGDIVLGDAGTQGEVSRGLEKGLNEVMKAALSGYAKVWQSLLKGSFSGFQRTLGQSNEANILGVFLSKDVAKYTAQELRNFQKYVNDELGSDSIVGLIIDGYVKDAEGKEIDLDLVARLQKRFNDAINAGFNQRQGTDTDNRSWIHRMLGLENDDQINEFNQAGNILLGAAKSLTNELFNEELRRNDLLLQASQERLTQIRSIADQGNAEQLQLEEERNQKLLEQRESFLQRQRQINAIEIAANNAVIISNLIKGVAEQFGINPVLGIVSALAAGGLVASTIASLRSALTSGIPAFFTGTEFLDGEGGIDNILVRGSRGERIVDRDTNSVLNSWGVKNNDLIPLIGSALGKVRPAPMMQSDTGISRKEFGELKKGLKEVKQAIYGIAFNVNIDPDGIGVAAGNYADRQNRIKKLMS